MTANIVVIAFSGCISCSFFFSYLKHLFDHTYHKNNQSMCLMLYTTIKKTGVSTIPISNKC